MLLAPLLLLGLASVPACKRGDTQDPGDKTSKSKRAKKLRSMPKPYRVPSTLPMGVHIAKPQQTLRALAEHVPGVPDTQTIIREALKPVGPSFAQAMAPHIGAARPWVTAHVEGEDIVRLPVKPKSLDAAAQALASYPKRGNFGAVELPAPSPQNNGQRAGGSEGRPPQGRPLATTPTRVGDDAPRLVWLDRDTRTLTIAKTERGLATGPELERALADTPVFAALDEAYARQFQGGGAFPFGRVEARGQSLYDMTVTATAHPERGLPETDQLSPGALTGMLDAPQIVFGASSRWAGHKKFVNKTTARLKREVDKAGFMAQAFMGKLVSRVNAALRSWNGRVFVGVGPEKHVLIGLGADDPNKMKSAVLGSISLARDNLSLLRMVASNVPSLTLRKVEGVHVLTIGGARKMLGKELAPLLDKNGKLKIAFNFSERLSAVQAVIGPTPGKVLREWRPRNKQAVSGAASKNHYAAAAFAADPAQLAPLLTSQNPNLGTLLGLRAKGKPVRVVVTRDASSYTARVTGG